MKSHELARKLLEMPDVNVYFTRPGGSRQPNSYDIILVDSVILGKIAGINKEDEKSLVLLKEAQEILDTKVNPDWFPNTREARRRGLI